MRHHEPSMPLFDRPSPAVKLNPTVADVDAPRLRKALARMVAEMGTRWWTATELQQLAGRRYGGRLYELRRPGIPFVGERLEGGEWRYRLLDRGNP